MRPAGVVMRDPLRQYPAQMVLSEDQNIVQAFPTEAAEEALTDRVQVGRLGRDRDDIDPRAVRGCSEVVSELAIVIPNQASRGRIVRRGLSELLGHPGVGGENA